jgi:hypothetical protein
MCDAAAVLFGVFGEDEMKIWRGEYYVSIKVICLRLLVLSFNCQRARADIVFMYLFFLTLDG